MKTEWILGISILIFTPCQGQLPFEVASEDLGNAEADFIDFFLSNPDMLFNALDINTETTTLAPLETITLNSGTEHTGTQQSNNGTEHTDHTNHGTEHTNHGTEHTNHGTEHTDHGIEHTDHGSETGGNKDSEHGLVVENGMVHDPVSGSITHLFDIHDGALLEVIQSEITGGHVIDPHTGELILLSEISLSEDTHGPKTTTVSLTSADSTTESPHSNHPGESTTSETNKNQITSQNKIVNGVIRDPGTGKITHIVDPHTGEHLKVIESPIFGAHVFDSKTGDLIIAEDHALEHGTIDVQPQTLQQQTEAPSPQTTSINIPETTTKASTPTTPEATTTTKATTTTEATTTTRAATTTQASTTTEATTTTKATTTEATTTTQATTTTEATTTPDVHISEALERTTVAATKKTFTTTVQTPVETTTKNPKVFTQQVPADHVGIHAHDNDHQNNRGIVIHNIVSSTPQTPSNRLSTNKLPKRRRKFGTMKGIYSILNKYKSEYVKTKKNRKEKYGDDNNNPNINKVLKWIERRKNQFKKVLHKKKHIEEENKINPNKRFKILDLETYFPSLKRNKFGGLEARKKWRNAVGSPKSRNRKSENKNTQSTLPTENNANLNRWHSRAIFQNPHSKRVAGAKQGNQQNTARKREFNKQMSTKLNKKKTSTKNNRKTTNTSTNTELSNKPTTNTSTNTELSNKQTINTKTSATRKSSQRGKRRKFKNLFANRRRDFLRRKQKKQTPVNKHSDKHTDLENYVKSLKEKVTENNPASHPEKQTAESYASDFARKINNKRIARDPKNVKLRKAKWEKSYLAGQTGT